MKAILITLNIIVLSALAALAIEWPPALFAFLLVGPISIISIWGISRALRSHNLRFDRRDIARWDCRWKLFHVGGLLRVAHRGSDRDARYRRHAPDETSDSAQLSRDRSCSISA
jgi:hypothetical protein